MPRFIHPLVADIGIALWSFQTIFRYVVEDASSFQAGARDFQLERGLHMHGTFTHGTFHAWNFHAWNFHAPNPQSSSNEILSEAACTDRAHSIPVMLRLPKDSMVRCVVF